MLDKIRKILHKQFETDCKGKIFDLTEDAPEAKCRTARFVCGDGCKVLAYKFDKRDDAGKMIEIFPFFAHKITDLKKMCDFILFYQNKKQEFFVVLCNLKSDTKGSDKPQLAASETFVNFIIDTIKRLYPDEQTDFSLKRVHYRSNQKGVQEQSLRAKEQNIKDDYYFHSKGSHPATCNLNIICRTF